MILNQTPPDQITVVVVQDGIEKMDSSIVDYFEEAQRFDDYYISTDKQEAFTWLLKAQ